MAFKDKIKKIGRSIKNFCKEHAEEIALIGGGVLLTGAACYGMYKSTYNSLEGDRKFTNELEEGMQNDAVNLIDEKTAWDKNWNEFGMNLEHLTHQPWGDMTKDDDEYVDPFEGNCFIVAGYNSLYNESPDQLKFYVLDNEGWYHLMPDENYSA